MCTVTIIPVPGRRDVPRAGSGGFRLVTNRDESRRRPVAMRPVLRTIGDGRVAAWPIDPSGGGTWVAAGSHGLVMAAMNLTPEPRPKLPPADRLISRGMLIPSMIDAEDADRAVERLSGINPDQFAPFRIVAADLETIVEVTWDRRDMLIRHRSMGPVCFASSGLGDHHAAPRLSLFDAWMAERGVSPAAQDAFHRHRWPDRPEVSVSMCRPDARTVSTTGVHVAGPPRDGVLMDYRDDDGSCRMLVAPTRVAAGQDESEACVGASDGLPPC